MSFETDAIRHQAPRSPHREHSVPIYLTSSFLFDSADQAKRLFDGDEEGYIYSRYANPNTQELVEKLASMEGAEDGLATASGMSAVFASLAALLSNGDHLLACRSIFGSTHQIITTILPKWGIEYTYVDVDDPDSWEREIRPNTRMLLLETPTNPALDIVDLERAGRLAASHGLILNVDNCFATPYLQRPLAWGAHIVTHSTTKFIDGQGRTIGGVVLGDAEYIDRVRFFVRHTGPAMSPFNAWVLSKSLETLAIRMDRHCENAYALARVLEERDDVVWVRYPFLESHPGCGVARKQMRLGGGLVTFEIAGGIERGRRFLDSLHTVSLTSNLGDSRTIATHPASTTHSKLTPEQRDEVGITPGLIRISVGLEGLDDITADIVSALDSSSDGVV